MPQISLYIDDNTLKEIEKAAKNEKKSISKWVTGKIKKSLKNDYPENFKNLFGAIQDDSFSRPDQYNFYDDSTRETI